ncbi:MAG: guanine deaminase [Chthoniobacterales bacterium]
MLKPSIKGLRGHLIDTPTRGTVRGVRDGAILIEDGRIAAVGPWDEVRRTPEAKGVLWLHSPEAVIIPGLIDVHAHLPQFPAVARVEDGLLPWLQRHVFPLERQFNAATARDEAPLFFEALARHGTTTAMLYATIYEESCDVAFEAADASGLRVILGKVMMDDGSYGDLPSEQILPLSLAQSERLCRRWHGHDDGRLEYAFSPRFAVTCTAAMMQGAADLAQKYGAYVQTHLSENAGEIAAVAERFPDDPHYTGVYERCGLLGPRSVFGHCIHLADDELERVVETESVIAHCPTSNLFLNSGIMPLTRMLDAGARIGLGSDVAGGPELNLWQVMRSAVEGQKARSFFEPNTRIPTEAEIFHLATQGGAEALGKGSLIGSIDIGKDADVAVLDLAQALPYNRRGHLHADLTAEEILTLLTYRGNSASVIETFVRGRSVWRAPEPLLL